MEYISAREAAAQWSVHIRVVQSLCRDGRVPGARKYGNVWMLPAGAQKPPDPRRARRFRPWGRPEYDGCGLLSMAAVPLPKSAPASLDRLGEERHRRQLAAEFAFLRGNLSAGLHAFHDTGRADAMSLCAATLSMAAASRTDDWMTFCETEAFLQELRRAGTEREQRLAELALATASLSLFAADLAPQWILDGELSHAPEDARVLSVYLYAKALQGQRRSDELLAVCKTALAFWARDDSFTLLDVYLWLLSAAACRATGDGRGCLDALEKAAALALPYGFIMPLAEFRYTLESEMEDVLLRRWPPYFDAVCSMSEEIWRSWNVFHTRFARSHLASLLTTQEYRAAYLIAKGASNRDTGRELGLSPQELKKLMAGVYEKLFISDRDALARYIL